MLSFLDTNILVYTDDGDEPSKQAVALDLLERLHSTNEGVLSTQVLTEYFHAVTRKLGVEASIARRKVEILSHFRLVAVGLDVILGAIDLHRLHQLSIWDSLIVKAAGAAGCRELLTEDLQHGQIIDGLRICNPFLPD
ncbi:MAG: PIN domain-containing protein [Salinisphaera sp.]|nr:PIN domain-containing protein [Salinisphaera sp.]